MKVMDIWINIMKESKIVKVIKTVISDKWFEKKESWWISDIWYQSITAVWSGVNMAAMTAIKIGYGEGIRSSNDAKSNRFLQGISVEWPYPSDLPIDGMQYTISPCQNLQPKFTAGVFSRENLWSRNKA